MKRKRDITNGLPVSKRIKPGYRTPAQENFNAATFILDALTDDRKAEQFHNWISHAFSAQQVSTMRETLDALSMYEKKIYRAKVASLRASLCLLSPYQKLQQLDTGMRYLEEAIALQEPMALCIAGNFYLEGSYYDKNPEKAIQLFEAAARIHPCGNSFLGNLYLNGDGDISKNYAKARQYCEAGVKNGHVASMVGLAAMYESGIGVKQDYAKAFELYLQAAEIGHTNGLCSLGIFYNKGLAVEKNIVQAKQYFILAARQNDKIAMHNLGRIYTKEFDYRKAFDWYYKASEIGSLEALWYMGQFYTQGWGVVSDETKALQCFEDGAKQEHLPCMLSAAVIHLYKLSEKSIVETGWLYMNKAIDQQFGPAIYWKGKSFFEGDASLAIDQDYVQARICFEKAVAAGYGKAWGMLGYISHKGLGGMPVNILQALKYYRRAKHQGTDLVSLINDTDKSLGNTNNILLKNEPVEPSILIEFMERFSAGKIPHNEANALLVTQLEKSGCFDAWKKVFVCAPLFFEQKAAIWNTLCDFNRDNAHQGSEEYVLWSCWRTSNRQALFENILKQFPDVLPESEHMPFLRKLRFKQSYSHDVEKTIINIDKKIASELSFKRFMFFSHAMKDMLPRELTEIILKDSEDIRKMPW